MFSPRSIAIVGASNDPRKWGHMLSEHALRGENRRSVYLVNRRGVQVLGRKTHASLLDLPEAAEVVVLAIPSESFEQAAGEALAGGSRVLVGITSGFAEVGPAGRVRQRRLVRRVREADALFLGPNCIGLADPAHELFVGVSDIAPGSLGLISQSGNLALEVAELSKAAGIGLSRFASVGNQADITAAEMLQMLVRHEQTRVIGLYIEDFRAGREFARSAHRAVTAGKPVILLSTGRSAAGRRAARSHTGALVSDSVAVDAMCRSAGVIRADTPADLVELAQALVSPARRRGRRVCVLADGAGHGAVAADELDKAALSVPRFSASLARRVAELLPLSSGVSNPVDLVGAEQDFSLYGAVAREVGSSGEVDAFLLTGYFCGYGVRPDEIRRMEIEAGTTLHKVSSDSGIPFVLHTMNWQTVSADALRKLGVPVYSRIEGAVRGLAAATELRPEWRVPIPAQASPTRRMHVNGGYWGARELLASVGVPFVEAARVSSAQSAIYEARRIGYPVVLKNVGLEHKSEHDAVVLGIASEAQLKKAWDKLSVRGDSGNFSVEAMAPLETGQELIIGARRDRRFGPIVLLGIGGIYAEVTHDIAVALAPVNEEQAMSLISSLRAWDLLAGLRGRPPVNLTAVATAVVGVSRALSRASEIAEIEVNPLLATASGAVALDVLATRRSRQRTGQNVADLVEKST